MIYLDSAAVVKLAHREDHSEALRDFLSDRSDQDWVSSALVEVETVRAVARYAPQALPRLGMVLDQIRLVEIDAEIRLLARAVTPPTIRSLDAIHLATALRLHDDLGDFITYDKRLADAARGASVSAHAPGT